MPPPGGPQTSHRPGAKFVKGGGNRGSSHFRLQSSKTKEKSRVGVDARVVAAGACMRVCVHVSETVFRELYAKDHTNVCFWSYAETMKAQYSKY